MPATSGWGEFGPRGASRRKASITFAEPVGHRPAASATEARPDCQAPVITSPLVIELPLGLVLSLPILT